MSLLKATDETDIQAPWQEEALSMANRVQVIQ